MGAREMRFPTAERTFRIALDGAEQNVPGSFAPVGSAALGIDQAGICEKMAEVVLGESSRIGSLGQDRDYSSVDLAHKPALAIIS